MFVQNRSFVFDSLAGRYVISRSGPAGAIDGDRAAEMILDRARRDRGFRSALARWAVYESLVSSLGDEIKMVDDLVRSIRLGMLRVHEESVSRPVYTHTFPNSPARPEHVPTPFAGNVIDETPRALLITHCPPQFDPRKESLRISYLLRDLYGRPVELVIRSETDPEPPVHRRMLAPTETVDGPGTLEWDGKIDATGDLVKRNAAPLVVQLLHDATYRHHATTTLPPALVHVVEIEDVVFATGRAILLPDGGADQDGASLTGLDAVAAVLRHAAFHEEAILAIFGHTDTVGSEWSNLELSGHRATNALHLVTGDADAWAAHCNQRYDVADFQRVLAWIARTRGWDTDPGEIDGEFGSVTRTARANFREQMNAEYGTSLKQGVKQSIDDWKAYFTLYDEELARLLEWSAEDLQRVRDRLRLAEPAAIGCGEAFPAVAAGQNNLASAANRRVDFVFFEPDELPELPGDPPGHELYGTGAYQAKYLPMGPSIVTVPIRIRLTRKQKPLAGVDYVIEHGGGVIAESQTDDNGDVAAYVPKDAENLSLRVPALGVVYGLEVGELRPLGTLAGVQDRLANLGYHCSRGGVMDSQTVEALKAFQFVQGLEVTGEVDDDTITRLRAEHRS